METKLYLLVPTLDQLEDGSSHFSMKYSVIKLPPSSNGGFHDNTQDSSVMFSTVGNLGASGRSEKIRFNNLTLASGRDQEIWLDGNCLRR